MLTQRHRLVLWSSLIAFLVGIAVGQAWRRAEAAAPDATAVQPPGAMSLGGNLLVNPGFEDGFSQREDGAVNVANDWQPWFLQDTTKDNERRPEWNREYLWLPSIRVLHGDFAQKVFNSWAIHDAGIYQRVVDVPVGATLEFSAWVQVWSSECDEICLSPTDKAQGCRGLTNGDYSVAVGIDPLGGAPAGRNLALPASIVWSTPQPPVYDTWTRIAVRVVAQSSTVTVFTRSTPHIAVKHNDSYWDTLDLRVIAPEDAATQPTVGPINSQGRPAQSAPAVTRTPAPAPRATLTPTATPAVATNPSPDRGCWEAIDDGGFESVGLWGVSANAPVGLSSARAVAGKQALRLGDAGEARGYAAEAWRVVFIPPDVSKATLRFRIWRGAADASLSTDAEENRPSPQPSPRGRGSISEQSVVVEEIDGTPIAFAMRPSVTNDIDWQPFELDLTGFRGRNVRVRFRAAAGAWATVVMDVDNVSLELCRPSGPRQRATQSSVIMVRPETAQQGGMGVRLAFVRGSLSQPDFFPFPPACDPTAFEFALFENFGAPINLQGWTLSDDAGNTYTFPYFVMARGYRVRIWTRPGPDFIGGQIADFYAGFGGQIWNDSHDTVTLRDNTGHVVTRYTYNWETE